jgi:hypothetical protein
MVRGNMTAIHCERLCLSIVRLIQSCTTCQERGQRRTVTEKRRPTRTTFLDRPRIDHVSVSDQIPRLCDSFVFFRNTPYGGLYACPITTTSCGAVTPCLFCALAHGSSASFAAKVIIIRPNSNSFPRTPNNYWTNGGEVHSCDWQVWVVGAQNQTSSRAIFVSYIVIIISAHDLGPYLKAMKANIISVEIHEPQNGRRLQQRSSHGLRVDRPGGIISWIFRVCKCANHRSNRPCLFAIIFRESAHVRWRMPNDSTRAKTTQRRFSQQLLASVREEREKFGVSTDRSE